MGSREDGKCLDLNRLMDIVQSKTMSYSLQSKFLSMLFLECNLRRNIRITSRCIQRKGGGRGKRCLAKVNLE